MATTVHFTKGKQASPKHSTTMLDPFTQLFHHCLGHAHTVYKVLWVVSFPRCTVGPNIVRSCSIRKLFLTVCEIENGVTMTPKRRSTDFICVIFYLFFFFNEKTCLNNRSSNGIQRPPTPTMVYTKETTTHSNRRSHTQLFAKYLFIYNLVPRYGLGINLHVWVLANQNKTIIANTVDLLFRCWTNWVNFVFVCLFVFSNF